MPPAPPCPVPGRVTIATRPECGFASANLLSSPLALLGRQTAIYRLGPTSGQATVAALSLSIHECHCAPAIPPDEERASCFGPARPIAQPHSQRQTPVDSQLCAGDETRGITHQIEA